MESFQPVNIRRSHMDVVPRTYTVEQAASLLGISRSTAYECVRDGSIPSIRLRRRIVVPSAGLRRMLDDEPGL